MKGHYFVAHHYCQEQNDDLRDAIARGLEDTDLDPIYADDLYRSNPLLDKLLAMISTTWFGIYDMTGCSPNVLLELGIGIACRKPLYITCMDESDIPSDIKGYEFIKYGSARELVKELKTKVSPWWSLADAELSES